METLSPSVLQFRNSFLDKFKDEKLESISKKLDDMFDIEKDPLKRIVILASRVETIRQRIEEIYKDEKIILNSINVKQKEDKAPPQKNEVDGKENKINSWIRVIMKESTEVNGVRFPEGIQIDVSEEDSKKLLESGKAAIIS